MSRKLAVSLALALMSFGAAKAQGGSPLYTDGMTIKLDSGGKKYIRFLTWATVWIRHTEANPGTAINSIPPVGATCGSRSPPNARL